MTASGIYDQLVGPFYDTPGLTRWRDVSGPEIRVQAAAGTLIACQLDGGQWVYPTWQFTESRTVHPHLITLWQTLRESADPWTCAIWLRSPQEELGDLSAADWITDGHPVDTALQLARAAAQRWTV